MYTIVCTAIRTTSIFFLFLVYVLCMYTVEQIAELTARGDSFVASVWRVAQSGDNEKEGGK